MTSEVFEQRRCCQLSGTVVDRLGWFQSLRTCSSSIPSLDLPPRCPSYHPHSCHFPYPQLSQGYWAPDSPPSQPLQSCPLSISRTFPNSVHIPCIVLRLGDSSHPGRGVSARRNVSCKTHSHSACSDAAARRVQRIFDRQARRRSKHGHLASNGRAWAGR